jgi:hypothetical protein
MLSRDEHGARIRKGLRKARKNNKDLGGERPATWERNQSAHLQALQRALLYRKVLEAGYSKTLVALSLDLFDAGCKTDSGKPISVQLVWLMKNRLEEAKLAFADALLEDPSCEWDPEKAIREAIQQRDAPKLHRCFAMVAEEWGDAVAARLRLTVLRFEGHSPWVRSELEEPSY